jgi:hypothetical protein
MEVINVLRDEHCFDVFFLGAKLLEVQNDLVTKVWLTLSLKFVKVIVPLPDSGRVLSEKGVSEDLFWIFAAAVGLSLFPKPILTSESGNTTGCTDASSRHY